MDDETRNRIEDLRFHLDVVVGRLPDELSDAVKSEIDVLREDVLSEMRAGRESISPAATPVSRPASGGSVSMPSTSAPGGSESAESTPTTGDPPDSPYASPQEEPRASLPGLFTPHAEFSRRINDIKSRQPEGAPIPGLGFGESGFTELQRQSRMARRNLAALPEESRETLRRNAIPLAEELHKHLASISVTDPTTGEIDEGKLEQVSAYQSLEQALKSLANTMDTSTEKTNKSISGLVAGVAGGFMIQQIMMMRMISQPYQYVTQPTLSAMGNMGEMGDVLSGAYGAQESVLQSYRSAGFQRASTIGGALGYLAGGMFGAGGRALGAIAGSAAGGLVGALGKDSIADFLSSITGDMDQLAFDVELGKRVLDPRRYVEEMFVPTMQSRLTLGMGMGEETFSEDISGSVSREAASMGYTNVKAGETFGQLLNVLAPQLSENLHTEVGRRDMLDTVAGMETYGMSMSSIMDLFATISRAGSEDYGRTVDTLGYAATGGEPQTDYTMNVLIPALSKVVESRAIMNISRSSENVERDTASLYSYFRSNDSALGMMLQANPETFSRVTGALDQVRETALHDPAVMLFLNRMGVSFEDVIGGSGNALIRPLGAFSRLADYDEEGGLELGSANTISSLLAFLSATGMGVSIPNINLASQMFEISQNPGLSSEQIDAELSALYEQHQSEDPMHRAATALTDIAERLKNVAGMEDGGRIREGLAEQSNAYFELVEENMDSIRDVQDATLALFSDLEALSLSVLRATLEILKQFNKYSDVDIDMSDTQDSLDAGERAKRDEDYLMLQTPEIQEELRAMSPEDRSRYIEDRTSPQSQIGSMPMGIPAFSTSFFGGIFQRNNDETTALASNTTGDVPHPTNENIIINPAPSNQEATTVGAAGINTPSLIAGEGFVPVGAATEALPIPGGYTQETFREFLEKEIGLLSSHSPGTTLHQDRIKNLEGNGVDPRVWNEGLSVEESMRLYGAEYSTGGLVSPFSMRGFAGGGFTGIGDRLTPAGVVHGGEYVISDDKVRDNRRTLEKIQSGEVFDDFPEGDDGFASGAMRIVLDFEERDQSQIINAAKSSLRQLLMEERLI